MRNGIHPSAAATSTARSGLCAEAPLPVRICMHAITAQDRNAGLAGMSRTDMPSLHAAENDWFSPPGAALAGPYGRLGLEISGRLS